MIQLCDESGMIIECCVWASVAESFDHMPEEHPVIALKGSRVTDFVGKQLTMDQDASY